MEKEPERYTELLNVSYHLIINNNKSGNNIFFHAWWGFEFRQLFPQLCVNMVLEKIDWLDKNTNFLFEYCTWAWGELI